MEVIVVIEPGEAFSSLYSADSHGARAARKEAGRKVDAEFAALRTGQAMPTNRPFRDYWEMSTVESCWQECGQARKRQSLIES
ncbi:MAG: hypothetical protein R2845_00925 [Thermomicrobiales bacterium]